MAGPAKGPATVEFPLPPPPQLRTGAAGAYEQPPLSRTLTGQCRCTSQDPQAYYRVLGLLPSATAAEVLAAYQPPKAQLHLAVCHDDGKEALQKLAAALDKARPHTTATRTQLHICA